MKIDRLVLGEFETNCYIARSSDTATDCLIIDTGLDVQPLLKFLERDKLTPAAVILTHGHIDHIAGVDALRKKFPSIQFIYTSSTLKCWRRGREFVVYGGLFIHRRQSRPSY